MRRRAIERPVDLVIVQAAMAGYRQSFVNVLLQNDDLHTTLLVGDEHFGRGLKTDVTVARGMTRVRNHFLFRRRALWQSGVVRRAFSADVAVLEFNPRILSNYPLLLGRRLLGRRTLLWGHAWARSGRESRTNRLRLALCRIADGVIVYTARQRDELSEALASPDVWIAANALYATSEIGPAPVVNGGAGFLVSGRPVEEKKPRLALEAFARALDELPNQSRLTFVGEGPLQQSIKALARELGIESRLVFAGREFDRSRLSQIYGESVATLSPGSVGLSMIQSHTFGLPMIYAEDEPHGPEIEAAEPGFNAIAFKSDDVASLAQAMIDAAGRKSYWHQRRTEIAEHSKRGHTVEAMVEGFVGAVTDSSFGRAAL